MPRQEFRGFTSPESSNVDRIVWYGNPDPGSDEHVGDLFVTFKPIHPNPTSAGGAPRPAQHSRYRYDAVPLAVYLDLRDASSVGSAFDRLVRKASFTYQRLDDAGLPGVD